MEKTKIVIFTLDSIYSRIIFKKLLNSNEIEIVGVILSNCAMRRGKSSLFEYFNLFKQVGVRYYFYQFYISIILPLLDKKLLSFRKFAKMNKKYFRLVSDVNINSIETELRKIEPDFLLSFNFNQKILENIFNIPKTAALNIHPSFLPFYRGIDPLLAARARNEDSSGVSVHLITEQIDQGDILAQKQYSIDYKKNIIDEYKELFRIGSELAKDVITDFTYYYSKRKKQNSIEGSYYSWPDANEYKKYRETKI